MSRRTDLLNQLFQTDKFGEDAEKERQFLAATAELILTDFINIALTGIENKGAGTLVINLINDSTSYMSGSDVEGDLLVAESERDEEVLKFLRDLMNEIDTNDWSNNVLITLISDAGTRTFSIEAGGGQESLRKNTAKLG
jgi:hypothetical protein